MRVDLQDLGFEQGGSLLVKRALRSLRSGQTLKVSGTAPDLAVHLRGWCRAEGHEFVHADAESALIVRGVAPDQRWSGAERAGAADPTQPDAVVERPSQRWGLAARGALVESGGPEFHFPLADKTEVWSADATRLYAQAAAAQWDPATAIRWDSAVDLPDDVEDAVVQVMTYLVENETAALVVPSRFVAQLHPHFREVMQLLAIQAADEARHIEVFTRCSAQRPATRIVDGRRAGIAADAGGGTGFRDCVLSAIGPWRRHLPLAGAVSRTVCSGSGDCRCMPARGSG